MSTAPYTVITADSHAGAAINTYREYLDTRHRQLFDDWRGYVIAWLALVWVANHLIGIYGRLRLGIKSERLEIDLKEAVSERANLAKVDERPNQRKAG